MALAMSVTDTVLIAGLSAASDGTPQFDFRPVPGEVKLAVPAEGSHPITVVVAGEAGITGAVHVSHRGADIFCDLAVEGHSGGFVVRADGSRLLMVRSTENTTGVSFRYDPPAMCWPLAARQDMTWEMAGPGTGRAGSNHRLEIHSNRRIAGATLCRVNGTEGPAVIVDSVDAVRDFSRSTDATVFTRDVIYAATGLPVFRLVSVQPF